MQEGPHDRPLPLRPTSHVFHQAHEYSHDPVIHPSLICQSTAYDAGVNNASQRHPPESVAVDASKSKNALHKRSTAPFTGSARDGHPLTSSRTSAQPPHEFIGLADALLYPSADPVWSQQPYGRPIPPSTSRKGPTKHRPQLPLSLPSLSRSTGRDDKRSCSRDRRRRHPSSVSLMTTIDPAVYPSSTMQAGAPVDPVFQPGVSDPVSFLLSPVKACTSAFAGRQRPSEIPSAIESTIKEIVPSALGFGTNGKRKGPPTSTSAPRPDNRMKAKLAEDSRPIQIRSPFQAVISPSLPLHQLSPTQPARVTRNVDTQANPASQPPARSLDLPHSTAVYEAQPESARGPAVPRSRDERSLPFLPSVERGSDQHEDRVSFGLPAFNGGRLRVFISWLRDGGSRSDSQNAQQTSSLVSSPPPVPPKPSGFNDSYSRDRVSEPHRRNAPSNIGRRRELWYPTDHPKAIVPVNSAGGYPMPMSALQYPQPPVPFVATTPYGHFVQSRPPAPLPGAQASIDRSSTQGSSAVRRMPLPSSGGMQNYPAIMSGTANDLSTSQQPTYGWKRFFGPGDENEKAKTWRHGVFSSRRPSVSRPLHRTPSPRLINPSRMDTAGRTPQRREPGILDRIITSRKADTRNVDQARYRNTPLPYQPATSGYLRFSARLNTDRSGARGNGPSSNRMFGAKQGEREDVDRRDALEMNRRRAEKEEKRRQRTARRDEREARRSQQRRNYTHGSGRLEEGSDERGGSRVRNWISTFRPGLSGKSNAKRR